MNGFRKAASYLRECCFCLKTGASAADKLKLVLATLAFHAGKRNGVKGSIIEAAVHIGGLIPKLRLRASGGDMFIFHEVLGQNAYHVDPAWLPSEPRTIVDLGGNVGLASLALAAQFPNARIITVEPHPENVILLRHNLQSLGDRVHIWEAAVADHSGTMRLNLANEHYNGSLVRSGPSGVDVRTVTLAEILDCEGATRIDVLKMDIEGAERWVLNGSPEWLNRVDVLLIELHDGYSFDQLTLDLAPASLHVFRHGCATASAKRI